MSPETTSTENPNAAASATARVAESGVSAPLDATPAPLRESAAEVDDIVGFIDGIGAKRISGWAMNHTRPTERLAITILLDGATLGTGLADRPRPDLERNGVGDGAYGFEIALPRSLPHRDRIRLSATAARPGVDMADNVPLENVIARRLASESANDALAAIASQTQQTLDDSRALQRRTDQALRLIAAELRDLRQRTDAPSPATADSAEQEGLAETLAAVRNSQTELARQLAEVGVIQARIDSSLAALSRGGAPADGTDDDRSLRRLVTVLTGVSGLALGVGMLSLFI
jgi:hypothetical protein